MRSTVALLLSAALSAALSAQVCQLSVAGLNRNRAVKGEINAECPNNPLHSAPFGNWGVTSNYGRVRDGHQFNGWCRDTRVCDNRGNCKTECRDGWYEWNSCTTHGDYKAPNCTLYNDKDCTEQRTSAGINVHGTVTIDIPVRCPIDSNNDGVADAGGCRDLREHISTGNFMTVYELDPFTGNDLVQTLYFPQTVMPLNCTVAGCPASGSEWVPPNGYDSPRAPEKVFAELATLVNSGTFSDPQRACRLLLTVATSVSSASFARAVAPESIVTAFGTSLAARTAPDAVRIFVTDSAGARRPAQVLYASPTQINYVVPAGTEVGDASLTVDSDQGLRATGTVAVETVAPAIFTADGSGQGRPAAWVTRANAAGQQTLALATEPISLGAETDQVVLTLYGTGWRGAGHGGVRVMIGGAPAEVLFAGAQPEFPGLDQINVRLSRALAGRGEVAVVVSAGGQAANAVTLRIL